MLLLIRNLRLKVGKLKLKFISLFKILEYISDLAYKLDLPSIYERLYPIFYISLLEEYVAKKG